MSPQIFSAGESSLVQTKMQIIEMNKARMKFKIGIPKESFLNENRIALVPHSIYKLVAMGHRVLIESGAGQGANFSDIDFSEAGAEVTVSREEIFQSDIIIKVIPPTLEELSLFQSNQVLISPLQMPLIHTDYLQALRQKRVTAIAMEYLKSEDGSFPLVRIMSEIAGLAVIHTAAELLSSSSGGRGVLLGGISGVPPAKVLILGAGAVAEFATRAALALGSSVRIFDDEIHKLIRIQNAIGRQLYTSTLDPVPLVRQLISADVVIGAIHSKAGRAPVVITEDMVMKMKQGSVIIDVSIDQGGCIETSKVTTHDNPTRVVHGVIHYAVPNIASKVSRTASIGMSNIIAPILKKAGEEGGIEQLLYTNKGFQNGIYTYKGCLTNKYLSERFGIKYTNLDLLLTSGF
ncbi:MAG: alanine dehydrogenase [Saprospiraceae bacterium]|nr:alanine dehydrogenase [Saprospiraceae bacterium]MBX7175231.1 alanine dehydrogenase [Saprospiraceae bacterium]HMW37992.1 alanine dehydrogenase [Saprospiraceae bacterium]HMX87666.1 alanine dehydrogenase [Saprospiraceae bacterium]HMZ39481.1 alanine dehydrogenase [Saprospiraceae bacterium]